MHPSPLVYLGGRICIINFRLLLDNAAPFLLCNLGHFLRLLLRGFVGALAFLRRNVLRLQRLLLGLVRRYLCLVCDRSKIELSLFLLGFSFLQGILFLLNSSFAFSASLLSLADASPAWDFCVVNRRLFRRFQLLRSFLGPVHALSSPSLAALLLLALAFFSSTPLRGFLAELRFRPFSLLCLLPQPSSLSSARLSWPTFPPRLFRCEALFLRLLGRPLLLQGRLLRRFRCFLFGFRLRRGFLGFFLLELCLLFRLGFFLGFLLGGFFLLLLAFFAACFFASASAFAFFSAICAFTFVRSAFAISTAFTTSFSASFSRCRSTLSRCVSLGLANQNVSFAAQLLVASRFTMSKRCFA